ncbi:MAG: CDP-alcohol phosphatidyltransferase family protein [Rhodoluna sp.]
MTLWQEWRTLPNLLSTLRLLLVPVFFLLILWHFDGLAVLVMAVASVTDYLDGYLARRLNQVTRLGQLLDPAADRLYILAALIGLVLVGYVPIWFAAVLISRDLLLAITYPLLAKRGFGPLPVHRLGKAGTFALLYALPLLLIARALVSIEYFIIPLAWAFASWGVFLYWWAGFVYLRQLITVVKLHPFNSTRLGN